MAWMMGILALFLFIMMVVCLFYLSKQSNEEIFFHSQIVKLKERIGQLETENNELVHQKAMLTNHVNDLTNGQHGYLQEILAVVIGLVQRFNIQPHEIYEEIDPDYENDNCRK